MGNIAAQAHQVCSEGAKATVEMLDHLERHKLLRQLSSDVIHILSLATLFQGESAHMRRCQLTSKLSMRAILIQGCH